MAVTVDRSKDTSHTQRSVGVTPDTRCVCTRLETGTWRHIDRPNSSVLKSFFLFLSFWKAGECGVGVRSLARTVILYNLVIFRVSVGH